jgi:anti-sigma regulatory factor (Ser/Thr protein kinase)
VEWCVDTRILGAPASLESEISAHLLRHCLEPGMVELAQPAIRQALNSRPRGLVWISLDWEDSFPTLETYPYSGGAIPGRIVAPGVARCHDHTALRATSSIPTEPERVSLAVSRAPEADLDPHPRSQGGIIGGLPLSVAGAVSDELAAGRTLEEAAARAGATVAGQIAATSEHGGASPAAIAELFIQAERQLGGDFHLVSADERRAVLGNRRCPFGPSAQPAMCRFTSAIAGGLAARLGGGAEVTVDERLALGDPQCRLTLDLGPPTGRVTSHRYTWPPAGFAPIDTEEQHAITRGFKVTLSLQLPRDRLSVPVTRHLVRAAMNEVGVVTEDIDDVELALSEACANVINHSGPGDAYEVAVTVAPSSSHIRVIDLGHGFDHHSLSPEMAALDAEHGRGVALMHVLVDQVRFESQPEHGTVVHLVKNLRFDDDLPVRRLMLESLDQQAD